MQHLGADVSQLVFESLPDRRVGARKTQVVEYGLHVEARATDKKWRATPSADGIDRCSGLVPIAHHIHRLFDVMCVDEMVYHPAPVRGRRLRSADVHPPVQAEGVSIDDLGPEALSDGHGQRGLPGRGRADDGDHGCSVRHSSIVLPRLAP